MLKFPPERIICLTEETVETLYLLGEERRIVGVNHATDDSEVSDAGQVLNPENVKNQVVRLQSHRSKRDESTVQSQLKILTNKYCKLHYCTNPYLKCNFINILSSENFSNPFQLF